MEDDNLAKLLAEVYLELTGGRQASLSLIQKNKEAIAELIAIADLNLAPFEKVEAII